MSKPLLLIHICCAPDAAYVLGLLKENYNVAGFFYNPNIQPAEEYERRLEETRKAAEKLRFPLFEEAYEDRRWQELTRKFRDEPEKGRRCDICYAMRLEKTARAASALEFGRFTTVMSLSPWKKADVLNRMGRMFARRYGVIFLEADFKKKDGFRKSVELSKSLGIYRQDYCGCLSSLRETKDRNREKRQDRKK